MALIYNPRDSVLVLYVWCCISIFVIKATLEMYDVAVEPYYISVSVRFIE